MTKTERKLIELKAQHAILEKLAQEAIPSEFLTVDLDFIIDQANEIKAHINSIEREAAHYRHEVYKRYRAKKEKKQ